ncbi:hypothetical protein CPB83DRAFT_862798 [Crepidotus variabilis]|uniref:Histone chaperone domain-containing protein n=1 Tax=Crepidotus variabilis TaxID=179855 RepID=A0A9P6E6P0_9AGAR|nr:hypothetical protein CPB83DRAFT_862798 [Crepidotus variabilis]
MDTSITDPTDKRTTSHPSSNASPTSKGKSKAVDAKMDEDEEADDDDDDDDEEEEDEEMEEDDDDDDEDESGEKIDPGAIVGRRTRGVRVDYTSKEALAKAGLHGNEIDEEEDEEMRG